MGMGVVIQSKPKCNANLFDRDTTIASGNQSITGVGFKPVGIDIEMLRNTGLEYSSGHSDGVNNVVFKHDSTPRWTYSAVNECIHYDDRAGNRYQGPITFDADGFTIAWVRTAAPVVTIRLQFKAVG